ncbi:MAG TPA: hypothetical protein VGJ66_06465 [Pyrinomonadaceae bacterium]|jgi:hypothetical protein
MPQEIPTPVAGAQITQYCPGEQAKPGEYEPGDFILTHGNHLTSRLIRFGQKIRFHGEDRKYTWWSHTAFVRRPNGDLIEAINAGVIESNISRYKETEYYLVHLEDSLATRHDRQQAVRFAEASIGQHYSYVMVVSIFFSLLTGAKFAIGYDGQSICSGLVSRALERGSAIFDRTPSHMLPADLAKHFKVEPPPPDSNKGRIPSARRFFERTEKRGQRPARSA